MTLNELTATEALAAMAAGEISSERLVRACLRRIDEREQDIRAWASIDRDGAIAAAQRADRLRNGADRDLPPLLGLPFGIKDIIATESLPTQYNSPIYRGHKAGSDAAVVAMMRHAGAIVLGKTETVEFAALGRPAPTRNPRDTLRTPSGSSSGSAAAVADFMVPLSLGTQTGGSLIRPGAYCGCVAFKPTYGIVSTEGVKPFAVTLDTIGWYARSVVDIALVARALEVIEAESEGPRRAQSLRIGLCKTPYWDRAEPAMRSAMEDARRRLIRAGALVEEVELGPDFGAANSMQDTVMRGEGHFSFLHLLREHSSELSESIRSRMTRVSGDELIAAKDRAATLRPLFDRVAGQYDAIVTPSAPGEAPVGFSALGDASFNAIWTLLHVPCITLPGLRGPSDMPVGIQLVAPRHEDASLLGTAAVVERLLVDAR